MSFPMTLGYSTTLRGEEFTIRSRLPLLQATRRKPPRTLRPHQLPRRTCHPARVHPPASPKHVLALACPRFHLVTHSHRSLGPLHLTPRSVGLPLPQQRPLPNPKPHLLSSKNNPPRTRSTLPLPRPHPWARLLISKDSMPSSRQRERSSLGQSCRRILTLTYRPAMARHPGNNRWKSTPWQRSSIRARSPFMR